MQRYNEISTKESPTEIITPYKSNGGQLFKTGEKGVKTLLFVDKFEITASGVWIQMNTEGTPATIQAFAAGDIILERSETLWNGTKHYQYGYNIYLDGEHFAQILTLPRSAVLDPALSQLRVENHILYRKDWTVDLKYILDAMGLNVNNFTGVDIAADGKGFMDDFERLLQKDYAKVGRATFRTEHEANGDVEGFYIGRRSSAKFIRGYRKNDELKLHDGNKDYIANCWKKNGMEREGVERLELSLRSKEIKRLPDFDWLRLEEQNYLAGVMKIEMNKFYEFVDREELEANKGNVSRCKKIQAIDFDSFSPETLHKDSKVNSPSVTWAAKQSIRFLMMEHYARLDKASELFLQALAKAREWSEEYGLMDWFEKKLPKWEEAREFHQMMRDARERAKRQNVFYLDKVRRN